MRKFTLLLMFALVAALACSAAKARDEVVISHLAAPGAAVETATRISASSVASGGDSYVAGQLSAKARKTAYRSKPLKAKVAASDVAGTRQVLAHATTGVVTAREAKVTRVTDDSIAISGFVFSDVTVGAKIDAATGKVSIYPQQVATVQNYPVSICSVDLDKNVYSETDPVTGVIENGDIHFETAFGFFVTSGDKKGAYLTVGIQDYTDVAQPNGRLSNQVLRFDGYFSTKRRSVSPQSDWIYVRQTAADRVRLSHLPSDKGYFNVEARLNYDKSISIDPQSLLTVGYSSFSCYAFTETVQDTTVSISAKILSPIAGSFKQDGDSARIALGRWMVAGTSSGILNMFVSSEFSSAAAISFPTQPEAKFDGAGTEADPYLIKSIADLKALAVAVNTDASKRGSAKTDIQDDKYYPVYDGKYFALDADLDFSAYKESFQPIGSSSVRFAGTFDGRGHTINKLQYLDYAYDYVGLFGATAPEATVKNLRFSNPKITTVGYNVGILAGRNFGIVDNVTVDSATISASGYNVGLIGGYNFGKISNVKAHKASISALGYVGGVAGFCYGDITSCSVEGATIQLVNKQQFAGGIAGYMSRVKGHVNSKLLDCSFSGTVYSSASEICLGGIAGEVAYTEVARCYTAARILSGASVQNYIAGLVGAAWVCDIHDCYATGVVDNANSAFAAGLVSEDPETDDSYGGTTITNCYAAVELNTASTDSIAGLVGKPAHITVKNSYFDTQLAGFGHSDWGKTTAQLTDAAGISGFDASVWNFTAGLYPRIKATDSTNVAVVSASPITLAATDNVKQVKNDFTYSTAGGVEWRAVKNGLYSTEGGYAFNFADGTAKLNYQQYTDTVEVRRGNSAKLYFINIAPMPFKGEGTAENPWEIGTREEYKQLVSIANNASLTFEGKHLKLVADIDLQGDTIKPIDNDDRGKLQFQGTFDGAGHTIDNMVVCTAAFYPEGNTSGKPAGEFNPRDEGSTYYGGLFGTIGANGVVKNVTVGSKAVYQLFCYGGAIAGQSYGRIEGCSNYGTVYTYYSRSGGIVGQLNRGAVVSGCYNAGKVYVDNNQAGGIAGYASQATIENCHNAGEVGAVYFNSYQKDGVQSKAGGIVAEDSKCVIRNVLNTGRVFTYKQVGGITGVTSNSTITVAVNYGPVTVFADKATSGHIAGSATGSKFADGMYDSQIAKLGAVSNGNFEGVSGLATSQLAAGSLKQLADTVWGQASGSYPVLKATAAKAEAKLASQSTVFFADGNFATSVTSPAILGNTGSVQWSLKSGKAFSIAGAVLTPTVPAQGVELDTLVASQAGLQRELPIITLNAAIFEGSGTAEAPYLIKNIDDYNKLADFVKTTGFDYEGSYFKLVNDIDFTGQDFKAVADGPNGFAADFNGNGKTLKGISYDSHEDKGTTGHALFGTVLAAGSVHDLTIDATSKFGSYTKAAAFVSSLYGKAYRLTNRAAVTAGNNYAGGIAATANGGSGISSCVNYGDVSAAYGYAGGIFANSVASAAIAVDSCRNEGVISGTSYVGGIAAQASAIITASSNVGDIVSSAKYAAGLVGAALVPSSASRSHNSGDVSAVESAGGIFGQVAHHSGSDRCTIDSCYNTGAVTAITSSKKKSYYLGGIVGYAGRGLTLNRSYNTADVKPESADIILYTVGGLVGTSSGSSTGYNYFTDCWNSGSVNGYNNVGGIGGVIGGDTTAIVTRCHNLGSIESTCASLANAGGIAGSGGFELSDSYNAGPVSAAGYQIGGIVGYLTGKPYHFTSVANYGSVTGTTAKSTKVGGIAGMGRVDMNSCYNFGDVTGADAVAGIVGLPGNARAEVYYTRIVRSYNAGKVTATAGAAGNITTYNNSCSYMSADSVYFDSEINAAGDYDTQLGAKGLGKRAFTTLKLGSAFTNATAQYPSLKSLSAVDYNSFAVAMLLLADGEQTDSVISNFEVGVPTNAVWTATPNLNIDGSHVTVAPKTDGEQATITLTVGQLSRTYDLKLRYPSGVNANLADKAVASREYYSASGVRISGPSAYNRVAIERTVYTDGTTVSRKVLYQQR